MVFDTAENNQIESLIVYKVSDGVVLVKNLKNVQVGDLVRFKPESDDFGMVTTIKTDGTCEILTLSNNDIFPGKVIVESETFLIKLKKYISLSIIFLIIISFLFTSFTFMVDAFQMTGVKLNLLKLVLASDGVDNSTIVKENKNNEVNYLQFLKDVIEQNHNLIVASAATVGFVFVLACLLGYGYTDVISMFFRSNDDIPQKVLEEISSNIECEQIFTDTTSLMAVCDNERVQLMQKILLELGLNKELVYSMTEDQLVDLLKKLKIL